MEMIAVIASHIAGKFESVLCLIPQNLIYAGTRGYVKYPLYAEIEKQLITYYNSTSKVERLVARGDIKLLDYTPETTLFYSEVIPPLAQHQSKIFNQLDELLIYATKIECKYVYIYTNNNWKMFAINQNEYRYAGHLDRIQEDLRKTIQVAPMNWQYQWREEMFNLNLFGGKNKWLQWFEDYSKLYTEIDVKALDPIICTLTPNSRLFEVHSGNVEIGLALKQNIEYAKAYVGVKVWK